uniref:Uncharacterized protein n=1 Tax=Kalanchoe fedtschenkoi TaxID=63787 RepID=A0A7N0TBG0_KALFE
MKTVSFEFFRTGKVVRRYRVCMKRTTASRSKMSGHGRRTARTSPTTLHFSEASSSVAPRKNAL